MSIGVCYFPEHWDRDRWAQDIKTMADIGIEYVRMGEFAWSRFEPEPSEYDFEWLADAVSLVNEYGMQVLLCTPTATPPKWLVDEFPSIRQEKSDGTVLDFGSRRHYCFNSDDYRRESRRITERLAEWFADDPAVAGWQIDNEFGCHDTIHCYCDDCGIAFRDWLHEHYDDIDALNEAWGTAFWSQEYRSFDEICPPRQTPTNHHPAHLLDYHRFASASVTEYQQLLTRILRDANDDWLLTHNFMGDFGALNARDAADDLDVVAWDSYPTLHAQESKSDPAVGGVESEADQRAGDPDVTALNHALYRGMSDVPFWVMEHQSGDIRGFPYSAEPAEGMVRLWTHAAIAHGAETVSYFRWRRCRYGQEQYWGGLCRHDGSPDRGLDAARQAAAELEALPETGQVAASVALVHDYDSLWALEIEPHSPDFDYWAHLRTYFRALRRYGVTVDVVGPAATFTEYDLVIAPSLYLVDAERAKRLERFVDAGGQLVLGARSGYADIAVHLHDDLPPGPLAGLVGAQVEQHESLAPSIETCIDYGSDGDDRLYSYRVWGEWLSPTNGNTVATHRSGPGANTAAVVRTRHGDGAATYVGVWPGEELADALAVDALEAANVAHTDRLSERIRLTTRGDLTWVLNYGDEPVTTDAAEADILLGKQVVPGHDLAVVETAPELLTVQHE